MRVIPEQQTVFTSAARTATAASAVFPNQLGHRGLHLVIDCTASADTPSVVFTIQGYSPLGNDYYTILASAAVTGAATTVLRVYPGLAASANVSVSDCLPALWRVNAVHDDTDSITYSVNAVLLP